MIHPLKTIRTIIADFRQLLAALTGAVKSQTAATVETNATSLAVLEGITRLETTAKEIQKAAAYLERADRFTRRSTGHEVPHV